VKAFVRSSSGSAAAEMALLTPLLMIILLGSIELGRYFYHEHKLAQSLRDAARFAARQPFTEFLQCDQPVSATLRTDVLQVARTGRVSGGTDQLPLWTDAGTTFTVTTRCSTGTTGTGAVTYGGIYSGQAGGARFVEIDASLPHLPIWSALGIGSQTLTLNARQHAAVAGI
jgi:Flp pilus assembly protein TadG